MAGNSAGAERPSEEAAHDLVMNGVSAVLLNIERALSRARKRLMKGAYCHPEAFVGCSGGSTVLKQGK